MEILKRNFGFAGRETIGVCNGNTSRVGFVPAHGAGTMSTLFYAPRLLSRILALVIASGRVFTSRSTNRRASRESATTGMGLLVAEWNRFSVGIGYAGAESPAALFLSDLEEHDIGAGL